MSGSYVAVAPPFSRHERFATTRAALSPSTRALGRGDRARLGRGLGRRRRAELSSPETVRPAHLIGDIVSDHEAEAARKGLRFEAHANRSLQMELDADPIVDALGNLVQNAVKYTTEGSVIIDAEETADSVLFCVRDTGPGIPEEKREPLFKHAQPGSAGGAGIGLQIAQHAAQAQGGLIEVESEVGKGSVFSLRLPRVVSAREAKSDATA